MHPHHITLLALLVACKGDDVPETGDTGGNDTGSTTGALCTDPVDPPCIDEMILDLSLHDDLVCDDEVSTVEDGEDFVTTVDASAGGMNAAANNPWVYVRFDESGASRVDIDDETALESMDWHLAARRFIIRLNSGVSGPSCVGGAAFPGADYATLADDPEDVEYETEDFYTAECEIIEDGSGLPGSPRVVLGAWWSYGSCVETTDVPFYVQLDSGAVVKLWIEAYYGEGQEDCNNSGTPGEDGAVYTWRWRFVTP